MGVETAASLIPESAGLEDLREIASACTACPLFARASQTVFGEGAPNARLMLIGEQPGDREDRSGRPFVGPAGSLLDRALAEVGVNREDAYVTNLVKHFKWTPQGRKRLHDKPSQREVGACLPWLERELDLVRPDVVVCLGATAAQALLGRSFRVSAMRGQVLQVPRAKHAVATVHPSSILRARDDAERAAEYLRFVADLRVAAGLIAA